MQTVYNSLVTYIVKHRQCSDAKLRALFGDPHVIDVTSRAADPWVQFSPFFPHGGIPVPGSTAVHSESVEGLWQGLKVFETADVDPSKLRITSMKGLKRTVRRHGTCRGHRHGFGSGHLLDYLEARRTIDLPAYRWVLEHRLSELVARLRELGQEKMVVLLDDETNVDVNDPRKPLSHAGLVAAWAEGRWSEMTGG